MSALTPKSDALINHLMTLHPKGFDLSLGRITALLERLDNPHLAMPPVLHIAGTNGKGSATAFARSIAEAAGLSVHVHTSPHLVSWAERYRLGALGGGQFVSDDVLADALQRVAHANDGQAITVFEILTAVTFVLFSEHPADIALIEVGLGGRFDATNVLPNPAACLIMPIAMDHEAYLGDTIEKIAFEKAGIIKKSVPVVIGAQPFDAARDTVEDVAHKAGAPVSIYGQDFHAHEEHGRMVYQDEEGLYDLSLPALKGRHQIANAAAAIRAIKAAGITLNPHLVDTAMGKVSWPARMQHLDCGALVDLAPSGSELWLDGGHNPHAGLAVAEVLANLDEKRSRPVFLIAGMINTKDTERYFACFDGLVRHVFCVPVHMSDAGIKPQDLAQSARNAGLSAEPIDSIAEALTLLRETWNGLEQAPRIVLCGSLYMAGEALSLNQTPPV